MYDSVLLKIKSLYLTYKKYIYKIFIPMAIIFIIFFQGLDYIKNVNIAKALYIIYTFPKYKILLFIFGGLFSIFIKSFYDYIIVGYIKEDIPLINVFKISWLVNTFNNILGFEGIRGIDLRTKLYRRDKTSKAKLSYLNFLQASSSITGLSFLTIIYLLKILTEKSILNEYPWIFVGIAAVIIYLPLYFLGDRIPYFKYNILKNQEDMSFSFLSKVKLSLVSLTEWIVVGSFFVIIVSNFDGSIDISKVFIIFIISAIGGIVSFIPGGFGAFDLMALVGLQIIGFGKEESLVALVFYRLFYYLAPWIIGMTISIIGVVVSKGIKGETLKRYLGRYISKWQRFWEWPGQYKVLNDFTSWILSIFIFLSGLLLIVSALTPSIAVRFKFASYFLTIPLMEISHRISIILGLILIVLSREIKYRVKRAYRMTLWILIISSVLTFIKGLDYEEFIALIVVALLLWASRFSFYRKSIPLKWSTIILFIIITGTLISTYTFLGYPLHLDLLKEGNGLIQLFTAREDYIYNGLLTFLTAWMFLSFWFGFRPKKIFKRALEEDDIVKVNKFLEKYSGNYLTHLIFLGDKNLFWYKDDKVLIPFSNIRDKLVVLGDPLGEREYFKEAINEFMKYGDKYGYNAVFYQVKEENLSLYHDNGYHFFKLGEEALIDLETFDLKGSSKKPLRNAKNRFEKEGYRFEIINPPLSEDLLNKLKIVSDSWLGDRKEMGFSIGWFDREYINRSSIAVIKDDNGDVLAFATLMPSYDDDKTLSVDLMRFDPNSTYGMMDAIFLNLIDYAKDKGCERFNLGMAPLSNVGESDFAHREERLAKFVYNNGRYWYGFKGLRNFKEKFEPDWESRFLAYPSSAFLPSLLLDVALLISKKKR